MSKKSKKLADEEKTRIGIFFGNFTKVISSGPQIHHRLIKRWEKGEIVRNHQEIDELVKSGAPIEVYYRDAD